MKRTLLLFLFLSSFSLMLSAEEYYGCEADNQVPGASKLWMNEDNGAIKFIEFKEPATVPFSEMEAWLKDLLKTSDNTGFEHYQTIDDKLGYIHYRFRQTYNNHTINHGVYYVHTLNGKIVSANGEFYPGIDIETSPSLTADEAIQIGKSHIHGHVWAWEDGQFPSPELNILLAKDGTYHLTYKTDIYAYEPLARKWLMIDATTGAVLQEYNRIHTQDVPGEAHCKYHGVQTIMVDSMGPNSYRLRETERGGGIETYDLNEGTDYGTAVDFTDDDNVWNTTTDYDDAALDAHYGTEGMFDYFVNTFGWESYDGAGSPMISYIHYGAGFVNAFWNGQVMTYGDGDGVSYFPLTSTEVVGHEIMHGITENTASLVYADESGGLNESYSDVYGTILDFEINALTANYLIGDDFAGPGVDPFRSMENPNLYENPDCYDGLYWDFNQVHNRSGVQNFFFYLLTQGGTGTNDIGNDYTVNAIPMASASEIMFRSLSVYLTPNSPYADARFYGIQSATDLFGDCSDEVINVTNGWHAVGVGGLFDGAVVASFNASSNYNCQVPAVIQFNNNSVNGAEYLWDFGNGEFSMDENPSVTYTAVGTYTVSLISTGVAICGNSDTLVQTNYITVTNDGGPTAPSCFPATDAPLGGSGIFEVVLETIDNQTDGGIDGYQDYTCTYFTNVQEGVFYPFEIVTGQNENIKIWVDVDNDGVFNNTNELAYESSAPGSVHQGQILIPGTDLYDQPLRLRVKSDIDGLDISNPCNTVQNGQVEDYTINISENNAAPAVDFVASETVVLVGSDVTFTDLTINLPETWYWEFPGGSPATSTDQHPVINYSVLGVYPVTLMATNPNGEDTALKTDYIAVSSIATMCQNGMSNAPNGIFYDSGGNAGPYGNNELCTFLIDPGCALEVNLDFTEFNLESNYDYMYVYDGVDETAPLIATLNGPAIPSTVTATSGKMYIVFDSDFSVTTQGWEGTWSSVVSTAPPAADFSISNNNTPLNVPVDFTDLSTEYPGTWSWDFGDGGFSSEQNPSYAFTSPGTYTVTLTVDNCFASDVISYEVVVQGAPVVALDPTSISILLDCGESASVDLTMTNSGFGELVYGASLEDAMFTETSEITFDDLNSFSLHPFDEVSNLSESMTLDITLNGDFDNNGEFASLYIDGNYILDIDDGNLPNGTDIVVQYTFTEAEIADWIMDGEVEVYILNSGTVDDDQGGTNTHIVTIQTTGSSWATANPLDGTISVGGNQVITVTFNSAGLPAGIYTQDMEITTNDPNNPLMIIPVTMEIVGEAEIAFSAPCLDFPPTMQFTSSTLELVVLNDGCAVLDINDIFADDIEYSVDALNALIQPGESQVVTVTFSPTAVGPVPSDLNFVSNIPTASVCLTGTSFGAPAIMVDPTSIEVTLDACFDSETVPVTITNTAFDNLVFSFQGVGGTTLDSVRTRLNGDFSSLTNLMPNFYEFFDGDVGNNINDGGGDMYDGGNYLSVDNGGFIDYSDDLVIPNAVLGTDGQYFTRKYPGLFVFAADINGVDRFSIDGNLGADGAGFVTGGELTVTFGGETYKGFIKRVHEAGDPSINHLIIVKDNGSLVQTIPTGTQNDDHDIDGLNGLERIYYLLFAEENGGFYSDAQMEAVMMKFLEIAESSALIELPTGTYTLGSGESQTFDFNFMTNNTTPGVYTTSVIIDSNDPLLSAFEIPVTINVVEESATISLDGAAEAGGEVTFSTDVSGATSWLWDFGDGSMTSTEESPIHVYENLGTYTVTLTVTYGNDCEITTTTVVDVNTVGLAELEAEIDIFPNPSDGNIYIKNTGSERYLEIEVINSLGQIVKLIDARTFGGETYHLQLENYPSGVYILALRFPDNQIVQRKFVLHKD